LSRASNSKDPPSTRRSISPTSADVSDDDFVPAPRTHRRIKSQPTGSFRAREPTLTSTPEEGLHSTVHGETDPRSKRASSFDSRPAEQAPLVTSSARTHPPISSQIAVRPSCFFKTEAFGRMTNHLGCESAPKSGESKRCKNLQDNEDLSEADRIKADAEVEEYKKVFEKEEEEEEEEEILLAAKSDSEVAECREIQAGLEETRDLAEDCRGSPNVIIEVELDEPEKIGQEECSEVPQKSESEEDPEFPLAEPMKIGQEDLGLPSEGPETEFPLAEPPKMGQEDLDTSSKHPQKSESLEELDIDTSSKHPQKSESVETEFPLAEPMKMGQEDLGLPSEGPQKSESVETEFPLAEPMKMGQEDLDTLSTVLKSESLDWETEIPSDESASRDQLGFTLSKTNAENPYSFLDETLQVHEGMEETYKRDSKPETCDMYLTRPTKVARDINIVASDTPRKSDKSSKMVPVGSYGTVSEVSTRARANMSSSTLMSQDDDVITAENFFGMVEMASVSGCEHHQSLDTSRRSSVSSRQCPEDISVSRQSSNEVEIQPDFFGELRLEPLQPRRLDTRILNLRVNKPAIRPTKPLGLWIPK